jgi:hypothetical protein
MFRGIKKLSGNLTLLAIASVTLATLFMGAATYAAGGPISLSLEEGNPGDPVSIDGAGFVADTVVRAYFSSDAATIGSEIDSKVTSYEFLGDAHINGMAEFDAPINFFVPSKLSDGKTQKDVSCGNYYVYVVYSGSKQIQAAAPFFVLGPSIVNPSKGRIGDYVNVNGVGLKANDLVNIFFTSNKAMIGSTIGGDINVYQMVGTEAVNPDGTLGGGVSFQIPSKLTDGKFSEDVHGGDYYFCMTYYFSRTRVENITRFVVLDGDLKLDPDSGAIGSEITLSGVGLRPNQEITVTYDEKLMTIKDGDAFTKDSGTLSSIIVVPESTSGSHHIVVSDVTGNTPDAWFTVEPAISLVSSAQVGEIVDVSGTGFGEVQDITIMVDGQPLSTDPPIITTNRKGSFTGKFRVPPPVGLMTVGVADGQGSKVELKLAGLDSPSGSASVVLRPATSVASPGYVGDSLTVVGSGFTPSTPISVSYGNEIPNAASAVTDAEGGFQTDFKIPPGIAGDHVVAASDGGVQAEGTFVLENSPPPLPIALSPGVSSGVKETTTFDWSDVEDKSGVAYIFQVASDVSFNSILLEKSGLAASQYALQESERLQMNNTKAGYYWRVRAVDGASNESSWTVPVLFYVGSAESGLPPWIFYVLGGLGVVLLVILGLWLRNWAANRRI